MSFSWSDSRRWKQGWAFTWMVFVILAVIFCAFEIIYRRWVLALVPAQISSFWVYAVLLLDSWVLYLLLHRLAALATTTRTEKS